MFLLAFANLIDSSVLVPFSSYDVFSPLFVLPFHVISLFPSSLVSSVVPFLFLVSFLYPVRLNVIRDALLTAFSNKLL